MPQFVPDIASALDHLLAGVDRDGVHHKQYAIDQAIRALLSPEDYEKEEHTGGNWDKGIA